MSTENLKAEAESLGIKVDGRWSDERIQSEIDKALGDGAPEPEASGEAEPEPTVSDPEPEASADSEDEGDTLDPDGSEDEQDEPDSFTVKNVGTCNYRINNGRIPPGGKHTFTEQDMASERLMRKTEHAIKNRL